MGTDSDLSLVDLDLFNLTPSEKPIYFNLIKLS